MGQQIQLGVWPHNLSYILILDLRSFFVLVKSPRPARPLKLGASVTK